MEIVSFEIAKKLKEKGFNEDCYTVYNTATMRIELSLTPWKDYKGVILAPTITQVLKWLREKKKIHFEFVAAAYGYNVIISQTPEAGGTDYYYTHLNDDGPNDGGAWDRYEDAALYCIEYVIDNLI